VRDKIVVQVQLDRDQALIKQADGQLTRQPLTEKVRRIMEGLQTAYFYATQGPNGLTLRRLAPYKEWSGDR